MYAAKAAQAAAVSPGGSPGEKSSNTCKASFVQLTFLGPMMSPGSQWGGSSYSGEGPYGGF